MKLSNGSGIRDPHIEDLRITFLQELMGEDVPSDSRGQALAHKYSLQENLNPKP